MCDQHNINIEFKQEIMKLSQILIKQNYFQFQDKFYIQKKGLVMGTPTSSIFSEIYLQHKDN
jgi:hypothetical protein